MMQSLLFFVPGTIVEVEPVHYPQNVWLLSGSAVKAEYEDGVGSQVNLLGGQLELDQDTVRSAVELEEDDNLRHLAAESDAQRKRRLAEASEFQKWLKESGDDLTGDLLAGRFLFFFTVPKVKFTLHFVFFLLYLGLLTYFVMLAYDVGDADTRTAAELRTVYRLELTLWLWSATRAVGETKDFGSEFSGEAVKMYIRDFWNMIDFIVMCLLLAIVGLVCSSRDMRSCLNDGGLSAATEAAIAAAAESGQLLVPPLNASILEEHLERLTGSTLQHSVRDLYGLSLILLWFRTLQYLRYYKSVGVLATMLNRMFVDVFNFITILIAFTLGFGFALAAATGGAVFNVEDAPLMPYEPPTSFKHPMWSTWWGMLGFFDPTSLVEQVGDEMPTAVTAPILLFLYEFVVLVVLLNLLIAQMSQSFGNISGDSERFWLLDRGSLITEFKDKKGALPPPLSMLTHLFWDVPLVIQRFARAYYHDEEVLPSDGFKLVPSSLRKMRRYQEVEHDALLEALKARRDLDAKSMEHNVHLLQSQVADIAASGRSNYLALSGRLDKVVDRIERIAEHVESGTAGLEKPSLGRRSSSMSVRNSRQRKSSSAEAL